MQLCTFPYIYLCLFEVEDKSQATGLEAILQLMVWEWVGVGACIASEQAKSNPGLFCTLV